MHLTSILYKQNWILRNTVYHSVYITLAYLSFYTCPFMRYVFQIIKYVIHNVEDTDAQL